MKEAGDCWFERIGCADAPPTPLVCSVPHAGRFYPPALLRDSAVRRDVLEELEDRYADVLIVRAVADGASAIVARGARAWLDLNRAPEEIDPAMRAPAAGASRPSLRVRSGLGLIPRRLGQRELIARMPDSADVGERLVRVHGPYHAAIEEALKAAVRQHGFAVLIDCHSMPPLRGQRAPGLVVGDRHGHSAARPVVDAAMAIATASGLGAALNSPYAGAYTLERHGRPTADVHAIQIEVDRGLYLDRKLEAPGGGILALADVVARIGWAAVNAAHSLTAIAAE